MKIAIMQPYLFPYIGYFQLINAVDKFVIYDDVNFIKQGWINKNQILINGKANTFILPLKAISSFEKIRKTEIDTTKYSIWKNKILKTVELSYKKAPFFKDIFTLLENTLNENYIYISDLNVAAIFSIINYLNITTTITATSSIYKNENLKAQDRVLDICKKEKATIYINAEGGKELYSYKDFKENGVELLFIRSKPISYQQFNNNFIAGLSIIDVLMFNSIDAIKIHLDNYNLS